MKPRAPVLIVEDDDDARVAMRGRLRASGYQTLEAIDATSAAWAARTQHPDLIR